MNIGHHILLLFLATAMMFTSGCQGKSHDAQSTPTPSMDLNHPAPPSDKESQATITKPQRPKFDEVWHSISDESVDAYHAALDVLIQTADIQMSSSVRLQNGTRLGDWFLLKVAPAIQIPGETSARESFVIDMKNKIVIGRDGWISTMPFFEDYVERATTNPALRTPEFVLKLAQLSAAVAAEAMECFVPTPGENLPDGIEAPRLTLSPPSFKLVWFSRNQATPPTYVRFELERVNGLTLHAEIVDIPWPMRVVP